MSHKPFIQTLSVFKLISDLEEISPIKVDKLSITPSLYSEHIEVSYLFFIPNKEGNHFSFSAIIEHDWPEWLYVEQLKYFKHRLITGLEKHINT